MFFCKFGKFLRTIFFTDYLRVTASAGLIKILGNNYRQASENLTNNESYEAKDLHKIYAKVTLSLK